jgi:hypothetical protein
MFDNGESCFDGPKGLLTERILHWRYNSELEGNCNRHPQNLVRPVWKVSGCLL